MYAVIRSGGKQYQVAPGETIRSRSSTAKWAATSPLATWSLCARREEISRRRQGSERQSHRQNRRAGTPAKLIVFKYQAAAGNTRLRAATGSITQP